MQMILYTFMKFEHLQTLLYLVLHSAFLVCDLVYAPYEIMAIPPVKLIQVCNNIRFNYFSHGTVLHQLTELHEYLLSVATFRKNGIQTVQTLLFWGS